MKALTLTQPWATLVAIGAKKIETRSWRTSYRGPIAIHAAKGFPKDAQNICYTQPFLRILLGINAEINKLARGSVIATAKLTDVCPMESTLCLPGIFDDYPELDTPQERAFGDYSFGRWAWILEDVKSLTDPIPTKGALSLWEFSGLTEPAPPAALRHQPSSTSSTR